MRHFSFHLLICPVIATLLFAAAPPAPALAQADATSSGTTTPDQTAKPLDKLFADLKRERDAKKAKRISERIWSLWRDSGSATGNLLMQWADQAMVDNKNGLALDFLDQLVVLMPDFAEGWNRRATLHYVMGNPIKSMADINRVLVLEPRHFGAMAGMAAILGHTGDDESALRVWERMLEVYPASQQAQHMVGELADKLADSRI